MTTLARNICLVSAARKVIRTKITTIPKKVDLHKNILQKIVDKKYRTLLDNDNPKDDGPDFPSNTASNISDNNYQPTSTFDCHTFRSEHITKGDFERYPLNRLITVFSFGPGNNLVATTGYVVQDNRVLTSSRHQGRAIYLYFGDYEGFRVVDSFSYYDNPDGSLGIRFCMLNISDSKAPDMPVGLNNGKSWEQLDILRTYSRWPFLYTAMVPNRYYDDRFLVPLFSVPYHAWNMCFDDTEPEKIEDGYVSDWYVTRLGSYIGFHGKIIVEVGPVPDGEDGIANVLGPRKYNNGVNVSNSIGMPVFGWVPNPASKTKENTYDWDGMILAGIIVDEPGNAMKGGVSTVDDGSCWTNAGLFEHGGIDDDAISRLL